MAGKPKSNDREFSTDFIRLQAQSREELERFLKSELAIGFTFAEMLQAQHSPAHTERLKAGIQSAISTIRHFKDRLPEGPAKSEITRGCDSLAGMNSWPPP